MESLRVGIIGLGTVGTGVFNLLRENRDIIARRVSCDIKVTKAADKNLAGKTDIVLGSVRPASDIEIVRDTEIDVVVELIGGCTRAKELITIALESGKHVVTANKALLATHGEEIISLAEKKGVEIGFEASVAGGIPIIKAIREGLAANRILSIYGIINGTSNYILTRMTKEGIDFGTVLADAQKKGFAESDPTFDIEGIDAAHKLLILAKLAFGAQLSIDDIYAEGISRINPVDMQFASEFGYKIKSLAIAKLVNGELEVRVHPTMVPEDYMLAGVDGVFNAVLVSGDYVGDTLFYGRGAGREATASAVVSDLIDLARNKSLKAYPRVPHFSFNSKDRNRIKIRQIDEVISVYYLRFMVTDTPGVLSTISGVIGRHGISISRVIQKARKAGEPVPVVIVTHTAVEKSVRAALDEISRMKECAEKPVLVRVEGEEI